MWIKTRDDVAMDLSQAMRIYCTPFNGQSMVEAEFAKNTVTLKTFKSVDAAKNYIASLVDELNGGKKPKLGYSFTWLSKVENLPPEKRDEFDSMVEDWLKNLQPADDKPKTFNDDGITW